MQSSELVNTYIVERVARLESDNRERETINYLGIIHRPYILYKMVCAHNYRLRKAAPIDYCPII
jgi:hypothetical protein